MVVISMEHTKPSVRGFVTKFLLEIRSGVFVGSLSIKTMSMLTDKIIEEDSSVDMVVITEKSKRIQIQTYGNPTRYVNDFNGISLLTRVVMTIPKFNGLSFFAKENRSLISHCLDVGYTFDWLIKQSMFFSDVIGEIDLSTMSFVAAMHDIGKLAPDFQKKLDDSQILLQTLENDGYCEKDRYYKHNFRHEVYSYEIMQNYMSFSDGFEDRVSCLLLCHHQGKNKGIDCYESDYVKFHLNVKKDSLDDWNNTIVNPHVKFLESVFPVDKGFLNNFNENVDRKDFFIMLGILMLSDWIASCGIIGEYGIEDYGSADKYSDYVYNMLNQFGKKNKILKKKFGSYSYQDLFGNDFSPRMLQKIVSSYVKGLFECILIESPMGEGKTEAAFYAAMNALNFSGKQGIYMALPTGATSEAMLPRFKNMLDRAGIDCDPYLATGTEWLSNLNSEREMIFRKIKLFSPFSVGTIDQILTAVHHSKYNEMKLALLSSKVVIFDEIHSYDAYMQKEIVRLLEYLRAMKVPVILLSATLNDKMKESLLGVYSNDKLCRQYPGLTVCNAGHAKQYKISVTSKTKSIPVSVENFNTVEMNVAIDKFAKNVLDSISNGGCAGIVVNTVRYAIDLYRVFNKLLSSKKKSDVKLFLLHSRMPRNMRERKEKEVLRFFGKDRSDRPEMAIVVSTQIIEMSMDLDFDIGYRQLAPIDAILQFAGRIARHDNKDTQREKGFKERLVIFKMKEMSSEIIYESRILKKTEEVLSRYDTINMPNDLPDLINGVYDGTISEKDILKMLKASGNLIENIDSVNEYAKSGKKDSATRDSAYECCLAVASVDKMEQIGDMSNDELIELYRNTVFSVPDYQTNNDIKRKRWREIRYFNDVYDVSDMYRLDETLGAVEIKEIGGVIYDV